MSRAESVASAGGPRPQADAMTLYQLARECLADVQGACDYAMRGPRQDHRRARQLLLQAADRIALSGEVEL